MRSDEAVKNCHRLVGDTRVGVDLFKLKAQLSER